MLGNETSAKQHKIFQNNSMYVIIHINILGGKMYK